MASNNDTLLILMSMGFEYADCETVLQDGVEDVEVAIQRLLVQSNEKKDEVIPQVETNSAIDGMLAAASSIHDITVKNKVVSRCELSDEHRQQKEEFERKRRDKMDQTVKRQRLEERKIKQNILNEIERDRKYMKEELNKKNINCASPSTKIEKPPKEEFSNQSTCKLQIRLLSGSSLHTEFDKECLLEFVLQYVIDNVDSKVLPQAPLLMQPFPKREFTADDMKRSLLDLSLFPTALLVVHENTVTENRIADIELPPQAAEAISEKNDAPSSNIATTPSSCSKSRLLQGNFANNIMDDDLILNHNEENHHANSSMFEQAVENRFLEADSKEKEHSVHVENLERDIPSLRTLSARCVACQLLRLFPSVVNSMSRLTSKSAAYVITYLKSKKKLTPNVMNLFLPCKLQEIKLDFYVLATNDLLERLRWHYHISKMSLKSCTCITDSGLTIALKGLHLLQYLNLTECTQLTGNILQSIAGLTKLKTLIMDRTKVKNVNVQQFLQRTKSQSLVEISFNYTSIDSDAFKEIPDIPSLIVLSINHTKVSHLTFLKHFKNLKVLGLKHTSVIDDQTTFITELPSLVSLDLRGTCVSNDGLQPIQGLKLTHLSLPDRMMVDDVTISIIENLPLNSLDLSDYIKLTSRCLHSISQMRSLKNLSLSNTKITDSGIEVLRVLNRLEVLDLSKTSVSNRIHIILNGISFLETLNLAWTKVDDDIIDHLNSCHNLIKLNMSHTNVTDKGISRLKLYYLNMLLLDWTEVTVAGVQICLENCPRLSTIRNSEFKVAITRMRDFHH